MERAASQLREGEPTRFERISDYATADLAYILEIERVRMKLGGADEMAPVSLRVTTIFRREDEVVAVPRGRHPSGVAVREQPEERSRSVDRMVA